jgi:NAD(P)-dependent dehydrogenase (short-subunit alcohol dehydrogenase family)
MKGKGHGRIINTTSSTGIYGSAERIHYASAKMGIFGFTKSLALDCEKSGIKVNAIAPMAGTRMT